MFSIILCSVWKISVPGHNVCISSFTDCIFDLNAAVLPSHGGNSTGNTYMYLYTYMYYNYVMYMSFFLPLTEVCIYVKGKLTF